MRMSAFHPSPSYLPTDQAGENWLRAARPVSADNPKKLPFRSRPVAVVDKANLVWMIWRTSPQSLDYSVSERDGSDNQSAS